MNTQKFRKSVPDRGVYFFGVATFFGGATHFFDKLRFCYFGFCVCRKATLQLLFLLLLADVTPKATFFATFGFW